MNKLFQILIPYTILICFVNQAYSQQDCYRAYADETIETLQNWYDPPSGQWKTTSWWNAANALTAIIQYSKLTGSADYLDVIDNTFNESREFLVEEADPADIWTCRNFINAYYDDEGWWVLAWMDAFDLTGEHRYLEMAKVTFEDMTKGWDDHCGGGVYWKKPNIGKGAIANELFLLCAVRLHQRSSNLSMQEFYLQWAVKTWEWFRGTGFINDEFLVENGYDNQCAVQRGRNYTYNQGVILSGLSQLGIILKDQELIDIATKIADAAVNKMVGDAGILKDFGEPELNGDAVQFKGIFMRHLSALYSLTGKKAYRDFILLNAESIWNQARDPNTGQIGAQWVGPFDHGDAARQSSALDAFNAAMQMGCIQNTSAAKPGIEDQSQVKVLTYNVWNGFDGDKKREEAFIEWVKSESPNVVALQELCTFDEKHLSDLAATWNHAYSLLLKTSGYPVGLTSNRPIVLEERLFKDMHHGLLHCQTYGIDFLVVHLSPFRHDVRKEESDKIMRRLKKLQTYRREVIVLGDFNALSPMDADFYSDNTALLEGMRNSDRQNHKLENLLLEEPEYGVMSNFLSLPLIDVCQRKTSGIEERGSYPTLIFDQKESIESLMQRMRRIDYILTTPRLAQRCKSALVSNGSKNAYLSDHFPVLATFDLSGYDQRK